MKHIALIIFLLPLIISCSQYPESLDESLKIAGKNKSELKKVLDYYSRNPEDSLKYKAACYLIENMKWHFGGQVAPSPMLWELFLLEDSLVIPFIQNPEYWRNENALNGYKYGAKKMLVRSAIKKSILEKGYQPDLNYLNAEFLIETIDVAFKVKELDWCKHLSFDDFCEFILSYRFNKEPVFRLRNNLYKYFGNLYNLDSLQRSPYRTVSLINKHIEYFKWDYSENPSISDLGFYNIFYWENNSLNCSHHVVVLGQIMRSIGLPVVEVFTPLGHSWCGMSNSNGKLTLFTAVYQNPGDKVYEALDPKHSVKLYIKTFGAQKQTPFFMKSTGEEIPSLFNTPCISDITGKIMSAIDIELDITTKQADNNISWFSIFFKGYWKPVGWGVLNKEKDRAQFRNIPVGLTGIACFFENGITKACSRLVTVTSNGVKYINPDKKRTKLFLTRKYQEKKRMQYFAGSIIGLKIEGANKADFSDAKTLYTLKDTLQLYLQDIIFRNTGKYQYYRLLAPSWGLHIAEIEFLSKNKRPGTVEASPLPVFDLNERKQQKFYKYTGQIVANTPDSTAFDGDMLTYCRQKWVGLNFGHSIKINRIRIAPRNANNGIVPGDKYQLYYWDNRWIKAGIKKAKYNFIEFEDVPANTLYWLRNIDHGTEEQPFFYRNGKQVFSNQ